MEAIHLVTHNRIAQFAARFEMPSDDSVVYYHPNGFVGGLPCTLEEAQELIDTYAYRYESVVRWMMYWAIATGLLLGSLSASGVWETTHGVEMVILLFPAPWFIYRTYRDGQKPLVLLGTRLPCSPPRSSPRAFWHRVRALPVGLIVTMLLPTGGLIYYGLFEDFQFDIGTTLIVVANLTMSVIWMFARKS